MAPVETKHDLDRELKVERRRIEKSLRRLLKDEKGVPPRLKKAMEHSLLAVGKRLRPVLLLWTWDAIAAKRKTTPVDREQALVAACALEMLHTYSLIHDDLPAMDDDDLRRGRPTCHVAFDEATAILAGDGLHARAFSLLAGSAGKLCGFHVRTIAKSKFGPFFTVWHVPERSDGRGGAGEAFCHTRNNRFRHRHYRCNNDGCCRENNLCAVHL